MSKALQPVVKVWLHSGPPTWLPRWGPRSTGDASPPHPNAAAALGTPAPAALLLAQILPVLPPHRANHARRGPRYSRSSRLAGGARPPTPLPRWGPRGASPVSVRRQTFHHRLFTSLTIILAGHLVPQAVGA